MNLFEEYKTLRKKHGLTASQAHLWCKGKATHAWRVALREWEFNANMIRNNMTERERMLWRQDIGHGREVQVFGGYDQDFDPLDGYCTTSYRHTEERWTNQDTISHEDGTYWVWANSDWVMVQFSDGLDTKYFRARGYAKQAKIDSLMLEFCPEEMTPEQMEEWARNQRPYAGDVVMVLGLCRSALRHAHLKLTPNSPTDRYVWEALNKADEVLAAAPGVQAGEKDNANVCGLPHGKEDK